MIREARKTEYRGIVFDSKSEAIFARTLDLACLHWDYHPEVPVFEYRNSHPWDFCVFTDKANFIEYKPSEPTTTYIKNLMDGVCRDHENIIDVWAHTFIVCWGNPWDGPIGRCPCSYVFSPILFCGGVVQQIDRSDIVAGKCLTVKDRFTDKNVQFTPWQLFGITETHVQSAKKFRFDLR